MPRNERMDTASQTDDSGLGTACGKEEVTYGRFFKENIVVHILDAFPGGAHAFHSLCKQIESELAPINLTNIAQITLSLIQNNLLSEQDAEKWCMQLRKLQDAQSDPVFLQMLGLLALTSKKLNHLALIPDGCRRWAIAHGKIAARGHDIAFNKILPPLIAGLFERGLHTFTVWYFNAKNLFRDKEEIINFIRQGMISLDIYLELARKLNVRIFRIGSPICSREDKEIQEIFKEMIEKFDYVEQKTKHFSDHHLILGPNYDPEDDFERSLEKVIDKQKAPTWKNVFAHSDLGSQLFPHPDLLIRTSQPAFGGRTGNFIRFSPVNTYFTPELLPDLTVAKILEGCASVVHPLVAYRSGDHLYVQPKDILEKEDQGEPGSRRALTIPGRS